MHKHQEKINSCPESSIEFYFIWNEKWENFGCDCSKAMYFSWKPPFYFSDHMSPPTKYPNNVKRLVLSCHVCSISIIVSIFTTRLLSSTYGDQNEHILTRFMKWKVFLGICPHLFLTLFSLKLLSKWVKKSVLIWLFWWFLWIFDGK